MLKLTSLTTGTLRYRFVNLRTSSIGIAKYILTRYNVGRYIYACPGVKYFFWVGRLILSTHPKILCAGGQTDSNPGICISFRYGSALDLELKDRTGSRDAPN